MTINNKINQFWHLNFVARSTKSLILLVLLCAYFVLSPLVSKGQSESEGPGGPDPNPVPAPSGVVTISVSSPDNGDDYCPYKGVTFTAPTNFIPPTSGYITYSWTFNQATIPNYSSASNQFNYNPFPPLISWDKEGTFNVTLTVTTHYPNGNIAFTYNGNIEVSINANCCGNFLLSIPTLTGTQTNLTGIYYMNHDVTIPNGHELVVTGTILVEGKTTIGSGPGGDVTDYFFRVAQGAEMNIDQGELRAHCSSMWGGIEVEEDAKFVMYDADISGSFYGIFPKSTNNDPYIIQVGDSRFFNNRRCITADDVDGLGTDNYIVGNDFDCNPSTFMQPFIMNQAQNIGESFRMEYGVKLTGDVEFEAGNLAGNDFNNGLVGLQVLGNTPPSTGSALKIELQDNNFYNNQIVGIYVNNRTRVSMNDNGTSVFNIPSEIDGSNFQYAQFRGDNFSDIPLNTVYGVATTGVQHTFVKNSILEAVSIKPDPEFQESFDRIGMYGEVANWLPFNTRDFNGSDCRFESLTKGAMLTGLVDHMYYQRNTFVDNEYSVFVDAPPPATPFPKQFFTCNNFIKSNLTKDILTFGVYIEDGTVMSNIGGNNPSFSNPPAGNGWPVNEDLSTGYPTNTYGSSGIDVYNWVWPDNWFSIYDANADDDNTDLGYSYFAYENEFFGDAKNPDDWPYDAVYPSTLLLRTLIPAPEMPCLTVPGIIYPLMIVASLSDNISNEHLIDIYPNPASKELSIKMSDIYEGNAQIEIIDMQGKLIQNFGKLEAVLTTIALKDTKSGIYMIVIKQDNGEIIERRKLIIN